MPNRTTQGQHSFAQIPSANVQRSSFDRSHGYKTTLNAGLLIPIFLDEALPGDTMSMHLSTFARLATPYHPVMDNMMADVHFFAVPMRLIWENWERFNGSQDDPTDSTDFLIPQATSPDPDGYPVGSLEDYFGIPTDVPGLEHSALFHRAYSLIWNEWYRDQNQQMSIPIPMDDGPDTTSYTDVLRRGKRHDYFSSCLPWPQKGPAVELPLGTTAPIIITGDGMPQFDVGASTGINLMSSAGLDDVRWGIGTTPEDVVGNQVAVWDDPKLEVDLSTATAATINSIRQAFQIQKLYERDARGGTRYTEIIRSHFGVTSPDQRLQRPEYLGGGSHNINLHAVPKTSMQNADTLPQGNLAAYGEAHSTNAGFTKSFVEHTIIIGLFSVRADLNYQQGLNRMWSRRTRWDFYWPALAHLGEQAVLNKEIYAQGSDDLTADGEPFGYQERFAEYRYKPSLITGKFRSSFAQSLDTWHLAQDFAELPLLGEDFIVDEPPIDRIIQITGEPHFLLDCFFEYKSVRPMPTYSVPGMIDHF